MSDELMIQPGVNPQIQPQKVSTTPYVLGGIAAGGLAGAGINHALQKPMGWEDVVKQAKDTVDFSGKKEAASWEAVKKNAQEVKDLEAKLSALPDKVLAEDAAEAVAKRTAQEAYDKEFARLVEIESKKGGASVGGFPSKKVLEDELTKSEYKMFEPYFNRYQGAKKRLVGAPGKKMAGSVVAPMASDIKSQKTTVNNFYKDLFADFDSMKPKAQENYDPLKKGSKAFKKIQNTVDSLLPEKKYKGTTLDQFKEYQRKFGEEMFEIVDKNPGSVTGKGIYKVTDAKGKNKWVLVDKDAIAVKRESMVNEYAENIKKYIETQKEIKGFDKKFFEANESALRTDLRRAIKKPADLSRLRLPKDVTKDLNALEVIETALNNKTIKYPQTLGGGITIRNANDLRIFKMQLEAEKDLAGNYARELGQLKASQQAIVRTDVRVDAAYKKLQDRIANDKGVKSALDAIEKLNGKYATEEEKALYTKIKGLIGTTESTGASTAEIEARVREAMKDGSFEKKLAEATEKYEKAAASKGTANTAAKEAVQKEIQAAKDKLKSTAEELGKKFKTGGTNKWIAAGIGAAIGAAALWGIANSKNKNA